jgi:exosortase
MNGTTMDRQAQLTGYLLLGVLLIGLAASFIRAWEWASRSWFWLAGSTNASYSPGPLIPVMVLLMLGARLRRIPATPAIASRDRFHAAFQAILLPAITAVLKAWHQVRGISKTAEEQEAEAYGYRAYGVWIVWGILGVALALLLYYGRQLSVLRPFGVALLFLHLVIFSAAVFYVAWRIHYADEAAIAASARRSNQAYGVVLLVLFLLFHIAAVRGDMPRLSVVSFLGCLVALVWFFYGWRVARIFIFPLAFMIFTLPMEWIEDKFGLRAQMLATKSSVAIMQFVGLKVNMIGRTSFEILQGTTSIDFSVSAPCSGLKSLVALTAISATYGYLTQKTTAKMVIIMVCGPFLAILTNIIRLVAVGVTAQIGGQKPAMLVHDHALPIYILGILLLMGIDKLINSKWLRIEDF